MTSVQNYTRELCALGVLQNHEFWYTPTSRLPGVCSLLEVAGSVLVGGNLPAEVADPSSLRNWCRRRGRVCMNWR